MPVSAAKQAYSEKLNALIDKYEKIIFVCVDNVRSQQLHDIRADLRGKAELLMGKNTLQKRIIANKADESEAAAKMAAALVDGNIMVGNRGLLFTNEDPAAIQEILEKHRIQAPPRSAPRRMYGGYALQTESPFAHSAPSMGCCIMRWPQMSTPCPTNATQSAGRRSRSTSCSVSTKLATPTDRRPSRMYGSLATPVQVPM